MKMYLAVLALALGCSTVQKYAKNNPLIGALADTAAQAGKQLAYDQAVELLRKTGLRNAESVIQAAKLVSQKQYSQAATLVGQAIATETLTEAQRQQAMAATSTIEALANASLGPGNEVAAVAQYVRSALLNLVPREQAITEAVPSTHPSPRDAGAAQLEIQLEFPPDGYAARGTAMFNQKRFTEALTDFVLASVLEPSPMRTYDLARTYAALGVDDVAIALYRRFIEGLEVHKREATARSEMARVEKRLASSRGRPSTIITTAAQAGHVTMTVVPEGSAVYIDSNFMGVSPLKTPCELPAGTHRVEVNHEGYLSWVGTAVIVAGKTTEVTATLTKVAVSPPLSPPPSVVFETKPPLGGAPPQSAQGATTAKVLLSGLPNGAQLTISGSVVSFEGDSAQVKLAPGQYLIEVSHPNFSPYYMPVSLSPYQSLFVSVIMKTR